MEAPSLVLSTAEHMATRGYFAQWRIEKTGSLTGYIDWTAMSPRDIQAWAYHMFEVAGVPDEAVQSYFRALNQYIYSLP